MNNVEDFYPLSPMQEGMLFHTLLEPGSGIYVAQANCEFAGSLHLASFERAWQRLLERHTVLRTSFVWEELEKPIQVVERRTQLPLVEEDWRGLSAAEQDKRLQAFLHADRLRGFDLATAPLMRICLIRTSDEKTQLIWTWHHLLLDAWSVSQLIGEFSSLYKAHARDERATLAPARPFREYIAWLRKQDASEAEQFWRRTLAGFTTPTRVQAGEAGEADAEADAASSNRVVEAELSAEDSLTLQTIARRHKLTLNTVAQGAWAFVLSRYSGEDDVLFGTAVSGRPAELPGSDSMVGLFLNTIPVRLTVPAARPVAAWLGDIQTQQVEARRYDYCSLVQVQGWSDVPRGLPLFEIGLAFDNAPLDRSLQETRNAGSSAADPFDISLSGAHVVNQSNVPLLAAVRPGERIQIQIRYDARRFEAAAMRRMLGHFRNVLESIAADPAQPVSHLSLLTPDERRRMLVEWNRTQTEYRDDATVQELFETQVARAPEAVALVFEGREMTYAELSRRANQLAHHLRSLGVGTEHLVGVMLERSPEMVVALLGVLKAGAAYLPLDPAYPRERLAYMLADARVRVLLTGETLEDLAPRRVEHVFRLDADWPLAARQPATAPAALSHASNAAYVIYTSGSTGAPKGVVLQHRGVSNMSKAQAVGFQVRPGDRILQFASLSFDASVFEIFMALLSGATLCLAKAQDLMPGPPLARTLSELRVTVAALTPSTLMAMPDENLDDLRLLISAGEACSAEIVRRWSAAHQFVNGYGPTEATVSTSFAYCTDGDRAPSIGRPMVNMQVYILDKFLQPCPVGVAGELFIASPGLARGYLNRPALTAEKFIPHPFGREPGARLYRTGDLARYAASGELEYLARIDQQVKIRGFRIELGEIEAAIAERDTVGEVVVVVREDAHGDKKLAAYVVPSAGAEVNAAELREHLRARLPDYMIPAAFVALARLPLTPNGKVDHKALPAPEGAAADGGADYVAPRDEVERRLAEIWSEVLGAPRVSVTANFFDLGGHSLLALRLMGQIQKHFEQNLPLAKLIEAGTIEAMARLLRAEEVELPWSPLVELNSGSDGQTPFFCVHPIGGQVLCYVDLAKRLGADRPFYGLQAPDLVEVVEDTVSIEQMAAHYIKAMREVQTEGPYHVGGHSFGGFVAYEMARQMAAQGMEVGTVALFDTWSPIIFRHLPTDLFDDSAFLLALLARVEARERGGRLSLSADELRSLDQEAQMRYIFNLMKEVEFIPADTPEEIGLPYLSRLLRGYQVRQKAASRYAPQPYAGPVTVFKCGEDDEETSRMLTDAGVDIKDPTRGWGTLCALPVEVHTVPGPHETMCQEPFVQVLAEQLRECLDAGSQAYAGT
ncbi:MAG TPA: amino acid adenylation domain-containing protein [Pyrinomonadaceae bacterium]|nr:amino acid adenylation domain-containing protein [Pyrinomonadaceae bacterium]